MAGEPDQAVLPAEAKDADRVSMAQRHVIEAEEAIARQGVVVQQFVKGQHTRAAAQAKKVLRTLEGTLAVAREHLRIEAESSAWSSCHEMHALRSLAGKGATTMTANTSGSAETGKAGKARAHIVQAERHVAHQKAIIAELERDGHKRALTLAREVLKTLEHSLALARAHVTLEGEDLPVGDTASPSCLPQDKEVERLSGPRDHQAN